MPRGPELSKSLRRSTRSVPVEDAQPQRWALQRLDARDAWLLAIVAVAFVTSRMVWLWLSLDTSSYWEESYRWIAALEILKGPLFPLFDYQADHYQGGSLCMILLSVGLLRVFGESILVMKLSAVLISTTTLCVLYVLGRRVFGRSTALVAALAYVAGPPLVAYWGLVVMGSHGESILFSLLQFLLFFEILSGHWRTPWSWAVFGLVSGLGLWFCYTSGLSLAACGITWIVLERRPSVSEFLWVLAGGILGLVPWFAYNLSHQFVGLGRIAELFGYANPIDAWVPQSRLEKLAELLRRDLVVGLLLPFEERPRQWVTATLEVAFAVPIALGLSCALHRVVSLFLPARAAGSPVESERNPADLLFIVYGFVFLAFFLGSQFTIDPRLGALTYRLLLPPAVILMLPAAHTVARGWRSGSAARAVTLGMCGLYLIASAAGTVLLASRTPSEFTRGWLVLGQLVRGVLLHRKFESDLGQALAAAQRVADPRRQTRVLQGIGWGMMVRFEADGDLERIRRELASVPINERPEVVWGLRFFTKERLDWFRTEREATSKGDPLERLASLQKFADEEWQQAQRGYRP